MDHDQPEKKKIDRKEAAEIATKASKLVPDVLACIDGVSADEAEKLAADAYAVYDAIKEALKD